MASIQTGDLRGLADAAGTATCWGSVLRTCPCFPSLPARRRRRRSLTPYLTLEMSDFSVFLLI